MSVNAARVSSTPFVPSPDGRQPTRACVRCHRLKTRCRPGSQEAEFPCQRCLTAKEECQAREVVTQSTKKSSRLSEVSRLSESLRRLEARHNALESHLRNHGFSNLPEIDVDCAGSSRDSSPNSPDLTTADDGLDLEDPMSLERIREHRFDASRMLSGGHRSRSGADTGRGREPAMDLQRTAFAIFSLRCVVSVNFIDVDSPKHTPDNVRASSELLYWTIIAVGSREAAELAELYRFASLRSAELVQRTLGGPVPSLEDLQGCLIATLWLMPIRSPGHLVALAYQLDIHNSSDNLLSENGGNTSLNRFRLWCQVVIFDVLYAKASGKPRFTQVDELSIDASRLLIIPNARFQDYKTVYQMEICMSTFKMQGEVHRRLNSLSRDAIECARMLDLHEASLDRCLKKWAPWADTQVAEPGVFSASASLRLQLAGSKLEIYHCVLRGMRRAADITNSRKVALDRAVLVAKEIVNIGINDFQPPVISYATEITALNFAFAISFLLKIVNMFPGVYEDEGIFRQAEQAILLFENISGGFHSKMIRRILDLVQQRCAEGPPISISGDPTQELDTGLSTFIDLDWTTLWGDSSTFDIDALAGYDLNL